MKKIKRLYRNDENKMLLGVCSGIAEYFEVDETLIRVAWWLLSCFGGSGLIAYILCFMIMPLKVNE